MDMCMDGDLHAWSKPNMHLSIYVATHEHISAFSGGGAFMSRYVLV
jgi:hypothetical protein